jgi:hypothetical protein
MLTWLLARFYLDGYSHQGQSRRHFRLARRAGWPIPVVTTRFAMSGGYFTTDRARKYGWGVPRLLLLTVCTFELVPRWFLNASSDEHDFHLTGGAFGGTRGVQLPPSQPLSLAPYLHSMRWVGHAYMGCIGAGVNVQVLGFLGNLAMLLAAAAFCVRDTFHDLSIVIYLAKTFSGDFLAGKLDTVEWRLVLFWTFGVLGPAAFLLAGRPTGDNVDGVVGLDLSQSTTAFAPYKRILPLLFLIQTVCEFGDARLEHHPLVGKFFRHRYGFEAFTAGVLTLLPGGITAQELKVVQIDLVICLFYRVGNLAIILHKSGFYKNCAAKAEMVTRKLLFKIFGVCSGQNLINVTDIDTAIAVLKASAVKGDGLERHVASPAWRPLISLESIDGELYENMVRDFHELVKHLPPPGLVSVLAEARVAEMLKVSAGVEDGKKDSKKDGKTDGKTDDKTDSKTDGNTQSATDKSRADANVTLSELSVSVTADGKGNDGAIDAHAICRLSLAVFVEYVFARKWEPVFEVLVLASWEWRREIAAKGVADAEIKKKAVELVVNDLLRNCDKLWEIHGEDWQEPRYYSLIMQPFLISPAINVGDVAVSLKRNPHLKLEHAMRASHPFPIFERFVDEDVFIGSGLKKKLAVRKNTQVIMFTSDFCGSAIPWPVFGAGPRMCAGTGMALGVLRAVATGFQNTDRFEPERGHKYSGRHNDGVASFTELAYFVKTVVPIVLGLGHKKGKACDVESAARAALGPEWGVTARGEVQ